MSYLVANPKDRFSRDKAHLRDKMCFMLFQKQNSIHANNRHNNQVLMKINLRAAAIL